MLNQLIEFTSSEKYLMGWNMWTTEVNIKPRAGELKIVLELFDDLQESEKTKQVWEITCEGYWTSRDAEQYKRPFNQIKLYHDHPVLWAHGSEQYFSVSGTCDNLPALMGDLLLAHTKATGNWIDFHRLFDSLPETLITQRENQLAVPEQLTNVYFPILDKYNVQYSLNEYEEKNEDYSVLLFSNPSFCPDDYYFQQPYIIAKNFKARRI